MHTKSKPYCKECIKYIQIGAPFIKGRNLSICTTCINEIYMVVNNLKETEQNATSAG